MKEEELQAFVTRYDLINRALVEAPWDMVVEAGDPVNPNNEFWWSPQFRKTLGFTDEKDFPNVLSSWSDRLHPEDQEMALQAFEDHLNDHSDAHRLILITDCSAKWGVPLVSCGW
ncbi:hypothetical protein BsIDN1_69630 [Bacillus safensis]|uniref:PAS fold-3 domain-containing protein n=1 Tax=Bacillus safensis TaxID=561879 RepID=A0A5S9MKP1_BACIA|nr:hypothetical protein BsIDN1_69630 [Bacillus safensis]